MAEKNITTDVLINGAGPTGLMMACQLAVHKIPFRIIDKKVKRESYSGAMILHARSMEILHQLGLSIRFLKEGVVARRINFEFNYNNGFSLDVGDFGNGWSLFPNIFLLEQSKTERLLMSFVAEHGYSVEEGSALIGFSQKEGIVTSVIKKLNDQEEIIQSKFLIEAGGSTSLVRNLLNIPFYGITHSHLLFVSDSQIDMPALQAEMLFTFTKHQTLGFFPLPDNRWRVDGSIPNLSKNSEKVDFEYVESYLNNDKKLSLQLVNSSWFSVFRSHSRYVPVSKHHHCFLVGDAAHVHSPIGAQGMNTGLHDAHNLSWKLAFFLKGNIRAIVLDTYQEERLPVAKNIIRYTDKAYNWFTDNRKFFKFLRLYFMPVFLKVMIYSIRKMTSVRKYIFLAVSGTGVNYRASSLSAFFRKKRFFDKAPLPGDRLPCLQYFIGNNLYNLQEKVKYTFFKLFVFGINKIPEELLTIVTKYNHVLEAEIIPVAPGTEEVYKNMVTKEQACYLVRPDLYIAWRSDSLDAKGLDRYLRKFIIPANATQET